MTTPPWSKGRIIGQKWPLQISHIWGSWYNQTLKQLQPGERVWINIPKIDYVGVGIVQSAVEPAS